VEEIMQQAVMTNPGQIEFREIAQPKPANDEVLIQIKVIFMPQVTCGECYACRHGQYHICDQLKVMGFQTSGAAQEYFPVSADKVLKLPAPITLDQGAMIEPVAVAVRAGDLAGKKVIVLGAGTIGNLVAQVAQASGALGVLLTDISDYKLAKARQTGIALTANTRQADLGQSILENFGPDKADLILECVGAQATIDQAIANARKGSTIIVVGVFGTKPTVDLGLVQDRELKVLGTLMYQKADFERAIELVASGRIKLEAMITARFPFKDYLSAYHAIETSEGQYMKVMIDLPEEER
jgi:L-iditol 2-dehydrogenase